MQNCMKYNKPSIDWVQLIRAAHATPQVPNQTPMPQQSKQMLCTTQHIMVHYRRAVKVPFFLPVKVKARAGQYPQSEMGQSISPNEKGLVHIPNRKGANSYPHLERGWSISPTGRTIHVSWLAGCLRSCFPKSHAAAALGER